MLTKEQFEKLNSYPEITKAMETMRCCGTVRNFWEHIQTRIQEVYSELGFGHIDWRCSSCVLPAIRRLSDLHFEYLENIKIKSEKMIAKDSVKLNKK